MHSLMHDKAAHEQNNQHFLYIKKYMIISFYIFFLTSGTLATAVITLATDALLTSHILNLMSPSVIQAV
jgi:hypothetical protein